MTNLTKLKMDRDTCYHYACAAYGQEFINALLWEGDEPNDDTTRQISETRRTLTPVTTSECDTNENEPEQLSFKFEQTRPILRAWGIYD